MPLVAAISISTRRRDSSFSGTGCKLGCTNWKISCSLVRRLQGASTRSIEKLRCWPLTLTVTCLGSCSGQRSIRISGNVPLDEIEGAHQHPLRIQAVLVEVVLPHIEQRLREDRELSRSYFPASGRVAARSWLSAPTRMPSSWRVTVKISAALHAAKKTMILLSRRIRDSECGREGGGGRRSGVFGWTIDEIHGLTMIPMCSSCCTKSLILAPRHDRDDREAAHARHAKCGSDPNRSHRKRSDDLPSGMAVGEVIEPDSNVRTRPRKAKARASAAICIRCATRPAVARGGA